MSTPFGSGWEGRVVEGKFPLLEWRGGSKDCGSFLTVLGGMKQAVIQLILASDAEAGSYLAQWNFAKDLSHPHISKVLAAGRCVIDDTELVYVVIEPSDASLSKIIRSEVLDAARAREIFTPVLRALFYLHEKGVVHGHINPSTIQLADSKPKLSVSDLLIAGTVERTIARPGLYDAPEVQNGTVTAVADAWSVGMTMYEAMTDRLFSLDSKENRRAQIVQSLPSPFHEIVQDCLQVNPQIRCTVKNILERLVAAELTSSPDVPIPVNVESTDGATTSIQSRETPLIDEPDSYKAMPAKTAIDEPVIFSRSFERFEETHLTRFRVMPYAVVLVAVLALVAVVVVRQYRVTPPPAVASRTTSSAISQPPDKPEPVPEKPFTAPPAAATGPEVESTISPMSGTKPPVADQKAHDVSEPETARTPIEQEMPKAPPAATRALLKGETDGTVIKRVLPNVSPGAFAGHPILVEAQVRVSVNKKGAVSKVEYVTLGPGNYFARLAERAARSWQFAPPMHHGEPESSVWILRFYFARNQTEASAERSQNL